MANAGENMGNIFQNSSNSSTSNNNGSYHGYNLPINMAHLQLGLYVPLIILGTALNLWMFIAIVTSPEMRLIMRCKLLLTILFNNVFGSLVVGSLVTADNYYHYSGYGVSFCQLHTAVGVLAMTIGVFDFWYLVVFLVHYLATILGFDPVNKFVISQNVVFIGTIAIIVGPWLVSAIAGPAVLVHFSHKHYGKQNNGCVYVSNDAIEVVIIIGIVVPFFTMLTLMAAIIALFIRNKSKWSSSIKSSSLLKSSTSTNGIGDFRMYMSMGGVYLLVNILIVLHTGFDVPLPGSRDVRIQYHVATFLIHDTLVVLIPLCVLFQQDVRTRLKACTPWGATKNDSVDLTVRYECSREE